MDTPENIFEYAYSYIFIIFLGIPATYLYNLLSGIIRSLGDSRTPVIFLVISAMLNIIFDLLAILVLHMGVAGAAWATAIAQAVAGIGCAWYMVKKFEILHIQKDEWALNAHMMGSLCAMGVPMGLQYSITAIGSVILQTATNTLGSSAVAAVTAAGKVCNFLACPYDAMGSTMATYGGQNVGAGKLERLDKGLGSCVILGAAYAVIAVLIAVFGGGLLARLFVDGGEQEIINQVRQFLIWNTAFYFPLALVNIVRFLIQGMGFASFAILAGVFEMIARSLAALVLVPAIGFTGVCLGSPIAWIFADAFLIPAYFHVKKVLKKRKMNYYST